MQRSWLIWRCLGIVLGLVSISLAAEPVARVLPPPGIELPPAQRQRIEQRFREVLGKAQRHLDHPLVADAGVLVKAIEFALHHGEFYQEKDAEKALRVLELSEERWEQMTAGQTPWARQRGRVVRGFRSHVDDSFQPYGLVIPDDVDFDRPVPLYVWLHGRGDKQTDLHFIHDRLQSDGQIKPPGAIVLHPFGRHCLGFKSAGETDVREAIEHVQSQYRIDPDRIVLMGFSMGGAGAWHVGAHDTDRFVAISPGAGFAETARYTNLTPDKFPPLYEQKLWGVYDVPDYVRNLFNRPVIAYSGENDKQIQAARIMEEAFRENGRELTHLIGPGMGHKYHPDTLKEIMKRLAAAVEQGRPSNPRQVTLQTRTLRYNHMDWVEALGLEQHWADSRIDAEITGERQLRVRTKNVSALKLAPWPKMANVEVEVDGTRLTAPTNAAASLTLHRRGDWKVVSEEEPIRGLSKRPGLQGPIDDAFLEPFLVVLPGSSAAAGASQPWLDAELNRFRERWRGVFRGELRIKSAKDVTPQDIERFHLVVWGTPATNSILHQAMSAKAGSPPLTWTSEEVVVGQRRFPAKNHLPVFVYPNPLNPRRYLVVNSGPTFREAHDRTNSLQNPKLPDWAIIEVSNLPDGNSPGPVVAADFFDEAWRVKTEK